MSAFIDGQNDAKHGVLPGQFPEEQERDEGQQGSVPEVQTLSGIGLVWGRGVKD